VIKGTPLQNSINPIDEYLITGADDLLPKAKNIPTGKQNSRAKIEIMNVRESPPHAAVSTHNNPKFPPEIKLIAMNGKINKRKIIIYFLIFIDAKKPKITRAISIRKERLILQISLFGYNPYTNLLSQTLIKIQHAPSREHSSFEVPIKSASKNNQFNNGGTF
jgi:hypothetical protein